MKLELAIASIAKVLGAAFCSRINSFLGVKADSESEPGPIGALVCCGILAHRNNV